MSEPVDIKILVLTSQTLHHCHFVRRLAEAGHVLRVFEEERPISAGFETRHPYEDARDAFERDLWFDGADPVLSDFAPTSTYRDLNAPDAVAEMAALDPDALFVFGTGKLEPPVLAIRPDRIVNLHGADPERYSGLDTHLWACYHNDFDALVSTLHRVNAQIDRGGVVQRLPLVIRPGMGLHELRAANTDRCVELALNGIRMLAHYGQFISQPQRYYGRHYSFMPAVLKDRAKRNFEAWTAGL